MQLDYESNGDEDIYQTSLCDPIGDCGASNRQWQSSVDYDDMRELVLRTRRRDRNIMRMTTQQAKTLRSNTAKASRVDVNVVRALASLFGGLFSAVCLWLVPASPIGQCRMYGHRWPDIGWTGRYPKCADCGTEITSKDMLRGSTPRSQ